ncbi:putative Xylosidase [Streptomyces afghaniensis 772] [Streptomyces afghaniensis]
MVDDWPVVGEVALDLPELPWPLSPGPVEEHRDDFELAELRPYWISVRDRPAEHCTTKERPGWLTLRARGGSMDEPDVVFTGRRQRHLSCRARTLVDAAEGSGGLAVRLDERHHYEIEVSGTRVRWSHGSAPCARSWPHSPCPPGRWSSPSRSPNRRLRTGRAPDPHIVSLGIEQPDGTFTELASLDGRYLSTEVAGGFTGRVIGMYAAEGTVHFDWFDHEPLDGSTSSLPFRSTERHAT